MARDISRVQYETSIRQGFLQFQTLPRSNRWHAFALPEGSSAPQQRVIFWLDSIVEYETGAFSSLLEILRTQETQSNVTLIGHGPRQSAVDDIFLESCNSDARF